MRPGDGPPPFFLLLPANARASRRRWRGGESPRQESRGEQRQRQRGLCDRGSGLRNRVFLEMGSEHGRRRGGGNRGFRVLEKETQSRSWGFSIWSRVMFALAKRRRQNRVLYKSRLRPLPPWDDRRRALLVSLFFKMSNIAKNLKSIHLPL